MKKSSIFLASVLTAFSGVVCAQEAPNRLLVTDPNDNFKAYVIDYVKSLNFGYVEGDVTADVQVLGCTINSVDVAIYKTEDCDYFRLGIFPSVIADQFTSDVIAIAYVESRGLADPFYEDFPNGKIQGLELDYGTTYSIVTVGYDKYGAAAGVCRDDFTTPEAEILGNPHVDCEILDRTTGSFTARFTPNEDVLEYYLVAGEKGTMQEQFEQFGPMFGFANMNQMIASWSGSARKAPEDKTWNDMAPNEDYEIFVAMKDKNGNFAPYEVYETSTLSLGGDGDAYVDIALGDYKLMQWGDNMLPSQFVTYTPNENTAAYRMNVILASSYDAQKDAYIGDLCSEPPMPNMANWWQYYSLSTDYQIDENTEAVVIAAGKNKKGEWGKVNELRFTTPASVSGAPARKVSAPAGAKISSRLSDISGKARLEQGKIPAMTRPVLTK